LGNGAEGWTSSQVVMSISEDMGNGMKAGYMLDMNLSSWGAGADSANQGLGTQRQSFLSLSDAKMGELRLGYQYTLEDQIQGGVGRATPTGNVGGRFQNFSFAVNPQLATASVVEGTGVLTSGHITRANAFQYASPVNSGFQVLVQAAQSADKADNVTTAGSAESKSKLSAIAAKYSQGPLNLGLSYQKVKAQVGTYHATVTEEQITGNTKATNFAANYDLGVAKVFLNKVSRTSDYTTIAGTANAGAMSAFDNNGSLKRTGTDLGVSAPFGKTTLFAAVASGKYKLDTNGDGTSVDYKIKGRLLGATYDLSKRTSLNAYYAMTKATYQAQTTDLSKKAVGFGIRHQF
jgi:predicted porin